VVHKDSNKTITKAYLVSTGCILIQIFIKLIQRFKIISFKIFTVMSVMIVETYVVTLFCKQILAFRRIMMPMFSG
jgi:hypothetical protein